MEPIATVTMGGGRGHGYVTDRAAVNRLPSNESPLIYDTGRSFDLTELLLVSWRAALLEISRRKLLTA